MIQPFCFIAMPFGKKDAGSRLVDFDAVWKRIIEPAIIDAGMQPLRADEEQLGGIIHKPMFERLLLCEFAVADITASNANVYYEIGVRHAARPSTTVLVSADVFRIPFDLAMLRTLPYRLAADAHLPTLEEDSRKLSALLKKCRSERTIDSPLFQLLEGIQPLQVASDRTDVFREQVAYVEDLKTELSRARRSGGSDEIKKIRAKLGTLDLVKSGVVIDVLLSFRALKDWQAMIDLVNDMPPLLRKTVLVQEQHAFALNRDGRSEEAEIVILRLLKSRGSSSETFGILGRIYKDRWNNELQNGTTAKAKALLSKAIDAYRKGFEADWRDHYPGVNAVTLMELEDPPDPERMRLIPVVRY